MRSVSSWRALVGGACLSASFMTACGYYEEPTEPVVIPATPLPAIATKVTGVFVDAKTGAPIRTAVTASIQDENGQPLASIQDAQGAKVSQFSTSAGFVGFAVAPNTQLPLEAVVVVTAQGFNASSARLSITETGEYTFTTRLVNVSSPPAGVTAVQKSAGSSNASGATTAPVTISTPVEAATGTAVQVSLPESTVITTASGKPLTGALQATVAAYNNSEPAALAAFPSGLGNVTVPMAGGTEQSGSFITAGFTAIEIRDAAGNVAANFSQPVAVSLNVPAMVNPTTGEMVKAGDRVPTWSYSEKTGAWKHEGDVELTASEGGVLAANLSITHLSYYTVAWLQAGCGSAGTREIAVTAPANVLMTLSAKVKGGGFYAAQPTYAGTVGLDIPAHTPFTLAISHLGEEVASMDVDDICGSSSVALDVPVSASAGQQTTLPVSVIRSCLNERTGETQDVQALQGVSVLAYVGETFSVAVTGTDGKATFAGMPTGKTLTVSAESRVKGLPAQEKTRKLEQTNEVLEFNFQTSCSIVTGGIGVSQ